MDEQFLKALSTGFSRISTHRMIFVGTLKYKVFIWPLSIIAGRTTGLKCPSTCRHVLVCLVVHFTCQKQQSPRHMRAELLLPLSPLLRLLRSPITEPNHLHFFTLYHCELFVQQATPYATCQPAIPKIIAW